MHSTRTLYVVNVYHCILHVVAMTTALHDAAEVRKRLGMPEKHERVTRQLKDKGRRETTNVLDPKAGGRRLGIFDPPEPGTRVMEPRGPNFAEVGGHSVMCFLVNK